MWLLLLQDASDAMSSLSGAVQEDHPQDLTLVLQSAVTERSEELKHVMTGTLTLMMDATAFVSLRQDSHVTQPSPQSVPQFVAME
jgi:hypothetical protein